MYEPSPVAQHVNPIMKCHINMRPQNRLTLALRSSIRPAEVNGSPAGQKLTEKFDGNGYH